MRRIPLLLTLILAATVPVVMTPVPSAADHVVCFDIVVPHQNVGDGDGEWFYGDGGRDVFHGMAGNDYFFLGGGDDTACGGDDHDVFEGDGGDDRLKGGPYDDAIDGGPGNDTIYVNDGAVYGNEAWGKGGNDLVYEGLHDDWLRGGDGEGDYDSVVLCRNDQFRDNDQIQGFENRVWRDC